MAASNQVSPGMLVAAVVVVLLLIGGLFWKFLGPGSSTSAQEPPTGMENVLPGPEVYGSGPGVAPGGAQPGGGMPAPR